MKILILPSLVAMFLAGTILVILPGPGATLAIAMFGLMVSIPALDELGRANKRHGENAAISVVAAYVLGILALQHTVTMVVAVLVAVALVGFWIRFIVNSSKRGGRS